LKIILDLSPCNHDLWGTFIRFGKYLKKHMACKVTYLLNAYDTFTSFSLNINQTCKINFAYRLWKVIYLFMSMKYDVETIIISSMNANIWKHGLRNQKIICCMFMRFMFPFYQTNFFYTQFSSSLLSQKVQTYLKLNLLHFFLEF
jgi:hypothetical protein